MTVTRAVDGGQRLAGSGDHRLDRLRELVSRLEQLPRSAQRDRVLDEVRSRTVDVDTGVTPRAMLPIDVADFARSHMQPARRSAHAVAGPAPAIAAPASPAQRRPPPPLPTCSPSPRRAPAPVAHSTDLLAAGERLCLGDSPMPHAQTPGEHSHRAWVLGLRG